MSSGSIFWVKGYPKMKSTQMCRRCETASRNSYVLFPSLPKHVHRSMTSWAPQTGILRSRSWLRGIKNPFRKSDGQPTKSENRGPFDMIQMNHLP